MAKKIYAGQSFLWQWLFTFWVLYCLICPFHIELYAAWETGYTHRKQFTVQGTNLDANVTHFPLCMNLTDADVDDNCDDDGSGSWDLMWTQSDGTTDLDIDWEDYAESGGNALIKAWVSQATWVLNADGSTTGYMYYENAGAGDPGTSIGVWDANSIAIWHLNESGDGTADEFVDSSGNAHHGQGGAGTAAYTPTQTGSGTDDVIYFAEIIFTGAHTFSYWMYADDFAAIMTLWGERTGVTTSRIQLLDADTVYYRANGNGKTFDPGVTFTSAMEHIAVVRDGSNIVTVYRNGVAGGTTGTRAGDMEISELGRTSGAAGGEAFSGILDEARLADTNRSAAWIKFEYYNANEADCELTWGSEESASVSFIPKIIIITGGYVLPGFIFAWGRRKKK